MSETLHKIDDLLPAEIDAEHLRRLAPVLWREHGLVVMVPEQIEDTEQRATLERLAEAFYGARRAVSRVGVGDDLVSPDGARWEALSASEGQVLIRRLSDGALASVHQPRGSQS